MPDKGFIAPIARSRMLSRVALLALLVGAYSALSVWNDQYPLFDLVNTPTEIHAALTLVLGWLLVFRTNTAYARWWEARTLWGALVNASRNLALKTVVLVKLPREMRAEIQRNIVAFPYSLRDHLRDESQFNSLPGYEDSSETPGHVPGYLVSRIYQQLRIAREQNLIDGDDLRVIDAELSELLDITGGCERIQLTRVVRSYRVFARQCVVLFLISFPWGISNSFSWWTCPLVMITAYFMIGLETVAEHVEQPFGRDEDDLDLDGLCRTINRTVDEIFEKYSDPD